MSSRFHLFHPVRTQDERIKRLFSTGEFSDITLVSQEKSQIKAHKCILSSSLKYFNLLFSEKYADHTKTEIEFNVPYKVLYETIKFLYYGEAEFDDVIDVLESYKFANEIGCDFLQYVCLKSISVENIGRDQINHVEKLLMNYLHVNEQQIYEKMRQLVIGQHSSDSMDSTLLDNTIQFTTSLNTIQTYDTLIQIPNITFTSAFLELTHTNVVYLVPVSRTHSFNGFMWKIKSFIESKLMEEYPFLFGMNWKNCFEDFGGGIRILKREGFVWEWFYQKTCEIKVHRLC